MGNSHIIIRRRVLANGLAASAVMSSNAFAAQSSERPLAMTAHGPVRGYAKAGVNIFKGVRYGADTGPVRFEKPVAPAPWTEVAEAVEYGPACPQRGDREPMSEDCLFLNVWTPAVADGGARPVMVYFHGGAYNSGSGSHPMYDGTNLVNQGDVVVVTVNHRLNAFGYLYLPLLTGRYRYPKALRR